MGGAASSVCPGGGFQGFEFDGVLHLVQNPPVAGVLCMDLRVE